MTLLTMYFSPDNPVIDARYVLHYNMPANKRLLGLRLHCMSAHYAEVRLHYKCVRR